MHSHDRTLLAKLGFADADKGDRRHDLACRYLATPEVARRLIASIYPDTPTVVDLHDGLVEREGRKLFSIEDGPHHQLEAPVSKGEGQYKTTIGFVDLLLRFSVVEVFAGRRRWRFEQGCGPERWSAYMSETRIKELPWSDWREESALREHRLPCLLGVEVKIRPVGVGEILRQVNLYREYQPTTTWVAATAFPMTAADVASLREQKVRHALLGRGFEEFVRRTDAEPQGQADSVEL